MKEKIERIVDRKDWKTAIKRYNLRQKNTLLCLFRKIMQVDTFKALIGVVHK